jgi:hypothetical protein
MSCREPGVGASGKQQRGRRRDWLPFEPCHLVAFRTMLVDGPSIQQSFRRSEGM